jgi:hypothetical protein
MARAPSLGFGRYDRGTLAERQRAFLTDLQGSRSEPHAFFVGSNRYIEAMPTLIAGAVAVIVLYSLLQMFRAANPAMLARAIKIAGGLLALGVAAIIGLKGELAVAVPIGLFGAGLLGWAPIGTFGGQLFERYLDRGFSAGGQNAQGDAAGWQGGAASGTKMTDEEAYQILGLKPGARRDEIGRAHRSLMKKLHPDQGGSTYLAARVNQAKEVLLRTHHK